MIPSFNNQLHRSRFLDMITEDMTSLYDIERASLFYLVSGNEDLYHKRYFIYDFNQHCLKYVFEDPDVDFSSSSQALIRLGFNLYNGWQDSSTSPLQLFLNLDHHNYLLAQNAMTIRFKTNLIMEWLKSCS